MSRDQSVTAAAVLFGGLIAAALSAAAVTLIGYLAWTHLRGSDSILFEMPGPVDSHWGNFWLWATLFFSLLTVPSAALDARRRRRSTTYRGDIGTNKGE